MRTQLIQDHNGFPAGVFIPFKEWELIKSQYPDIEQIEEDLPDWEKKIIDDRLAKAINHPESLQPIENLFKELKKKI
jgi:hypothetical protein